MPELVAKINFEVYCGICGTGVCYDTTVNGTTITVECHVCKETIRQLELKKGKVKTKLKAGEIPAFLRKGE